MQEMGPTVYQWQIQGEGSGGQDPLSPFQALRLFDTEFLKIRKNTNCSKHLLLKKKLHVLEEVIRITGESIGANVTQPIQKENTSQSLTMR